MNSYNTAVLDGNPDLDAVIVALRLQLGRLPAERFDYVILAKVASDRHGLALARPMPALTAANRRIALHISTESVADLENPPYKKRRWDL